MRGIWWVLLSVLGSSAMAVAVRDISTQIDSRTIVFLRSAVFSGANLANMRGDIALSIIVVAGALRGYADIEAYHHGEAGILAPITYLRLVFITTAASFMYQEVPDTFTIYGALIVISATLYIALRDARLKRLSGRSAPP